MTDDRKPKTGEDGTKDEHATKSGAASADDRREATKEEELEEGLEESMSGSDAPASTRRSEKD